MIDPTKVLPIVVMQDFFRKYRLPEMSKLNWYNSILKITITYITLSSTSLIHYRMNGYLIIPVAS